TLQARIERLQHNAHAAAAENAHHLKVRQSAKVRGIGRRRKKVRRAIADASNGFWSDRRRQCCDLAGRANRRPKSAFCSRLRFMHSLDNSQKVRPARCQLLKLRLATFTLTEMLCKLGLLLFAKRTTEQLA